MLSLLVFIGEGLRDAFDPRHALAPLKPGKARPLTAVEEPANER
jgi:microcin C transport system permease protein